MFDLESIIYLLGASYIIVSGIYIFKLKKLNSSNSLTIEYWSDKYFELDEIYLKLLKEQSKKKVAGKKK